MNISKETYDGADADTQRSMIFDLTLDLHETIKGNSKPGLIDDVSCLKAEVGKTTTSIRWLKGLLFLIWGALAGVVGLK